MKAPIISVIIPCRNESRYIRKTLDSIVNQSFNLEEMEILVVDGMSTDNTVYVLKEYIGRFPQIRIIQNEKQITAAARNIGLKEAQGKYIAMIDAHCEISPEYLQSCIVALLKYPTEIMCVAGRTRALGVSVKGDVIALAMSSSFGVGNAVFRWSDIEMDCSSAAFGVYRKEIFALIGNYDEKMLYAEDDELSLRIWNAGFRIHMLPEIYAMYWVRETFRGLWSQYYNYGQGKVRLLRKHSSLPSWRVILPAAFVSTLIITFLSGLAVPPLLGLWLGVVVLYSVSNLFAALSMAKGEIKKAISLFQAYFCLHSAYGIGFLTGLIRKNK